MPIKNYATRANVHSVIARIQRTLAQAGARSVSVQYDGHGEPAAVLFALEWRNGKTFAIRLPARVAAVQKILENDPKVAGRRQAPDHARAVAWRNVEDWIAAQLALIEAGQIEIAEAFLPYTVEPKSDKTLYEVLRDRPELPDGRRRPDLLPTWEDVMNAPRWEDLSDDEKRKRIEGYSDGGLPEAGEWER